MACFSAEKRKLGKICEFERGQRYELEQVEITVELCNAHTGDLIDSKTWLTSDTCPAIVYVNRNQKTIHNSNIIWKDDILEWLSRYVEY